MNILLDEKTQGRGLKGQDLRLNAEDIKVNKIFDIKSSLLLAQN